MNQPGQQLSALERLQKIVGIETRQEKIDRERMAKTFQIDQNDPAQQAGIARGGQMVRALEYSALLRSDPKRAAQQLAIAQEHSRQTIKTINEYRDRTGRDPAPILTPQQRDYLRSNQDTLGTQAEREALREGLDRAIIHGESSKTAPLDHELRDWHRQPEPKTQHHQPDHSRGESFRGR